MTPPQAGRRLRVLVQAGHVSPRDPNHENETGAAGEQELALQIRTYLKILIARDPRLEGIYVPGLIPRGIRCDAAIFLHGDGSSNPASSGYCFGYPAGTVNKRLADMIGDEFDKLAGHPPHRTDNYTGGLRGYYGYSRVDTAGPEVVVEHGFLSNPRERVWMQQNAHLLAAAEYAALLRYFKLPPLGVPVPVRRKWSYRVEEAGRDKLGKTDFPGLSVTRIARRLKKGERIILERL